MAATGAEVDLGRTVVIWGGGGKARDVEDGRMRDSVSHGEASSAYEASCEKLCIHPPGA